MKPLSRSDRKLLKEAKDLTRAARKLMRVQRDVLKPETRELLEPAVAALDEAVQARDPDAARKASAEVDRQLTCHVPQARRSALRENVEVFLVAAIVAMGVRTFFIQPFKIPTGSMQPTLYGIVQEPHAGKVPNPVMRLINLVFLGKTHGAQGSKVRGDHIFVDKFSYHFRKPKRGEVIVFETENIQEMSRRIRGPFYIKRLVGLGGDILRLRAPYLEVNGEVLDSRPVFERLYSMKDGYNGYVAQPPGGQRPRYLYNPAATYTVPDRHLFVLGDNSKSSSDGRYWGSLPEENLVGRAIMVYWPFSLRFGLID